MNKKYLIITGGSRGIGEKTIARFIQDSWQIINVSRTPCATSNVVNFSIDLAHAENILQHADKLRAAIKESNSKICLVHNAAFSKRDHVAHITLQDLQTTLATNVIAPALLNTLFIPFMSAGSSIIYIGSTLSTKAVPDSASYSTAKHALVGLMKATCQDLIPQEIHTCCVCPGLVDTLLLKQSLDSAVVEHIINTQVMGKRLIKPDEIADLIYFCANNPVVNGATIHANLGQAAE